MMHIGKCQQHGDKMGEAKRRKLSGQYPAKDNAKSQPEENKLSDASNQAKEGDVCPKTGVWTPANNPRFHPSDYFNRVMVRTFYQGEIMPKTPHGEPYWAYNTPTTPIKNLSGLTAEEIEAQFSNKK